MQSNDTLNPVPDKVHQTADGLPTPVKVVTTVTPTTKTPRTDRFRDWIAAYAADLRRGQR